MRLHFTYKNYPGAPELTERSRKIGTYTHWLFALVYGSLIGMVLMTGGGSDDPNVFNYEMFSWRRITLAPILIVGGFAFEIYALLKRF